MTILHTEGQKQVALLFADIIAPFDESRHRLYDMFDGETWTPGCRVCAMGAVMEGLIPENVLRTTPSTNEELYDALYEAVQSRIGPVQRTEMSDVFTEAIRANDTWELSFKKIAAYLRSEAGA